jgi:hypothetical protein
MSPVGSTRYSPSGMKKECSLDMCVRLSSKEDDVCAQKRQCSGESRDRAAAILSSSVAAFSSSKSSASASGCPNAVDSEWVGGVSFVVSAEASGVRSSKGDAFAAAASAGRGLGWSTWDRDFTSFSRCFLDSIWDRYAFSVVYALLMTLNNQLPKGSEKDVTPTCRSRRSSLWAIMLQRSPAFSRAPSD